MNKRNTARVKVDINRALLKELDRWIEQGYFRNRNDAINMGLKEVLRLDKLNCMIPATKEMTIRTVWIPDTYIRLIDRLVKTGFYSCRAEFIRDAIRHLLQHLISKILVKISG